MFKIGDVFYYRAIGVCRVEDIREEAFTGQKQTYYILTPLDHANSSIYVPLDNESLKERMLPLLTKTQAQTVLSSGETQAWEENPKLRQTAYTEIISGEDRSRIAAVLRALLRHRREVTDAGRKFYASDVRLLEAAENAVVGELAHVLGVSREVILAKLGE